MQRVLTVVVLLWTICASAHEGPDIEIVVGNGGGHGNLDGQGLEARFDSPDKLAVSSDGSVYVHNWRDGRLALVSPTGAVGTIRVASEALARRLSAIAALPNGDVVAVQHSTHTVIRLRRDGSVVWATGARQPAGLRDGPINTAQFDEPLSVSADAAGHVYVLDQRGTRLRRIDADGTRVSTLPMQLHGQRYNAIGLAPNGALWALDSDRHQVIRFANKGRIAQVIGGSHDPSSVDADRLRDGAPTRARFYKPKSLAFWRDEVFVADADNHAIRRIAASGAVSTVFRTKCPTWHLCQADAADQEPFAVGSPTAIAVAPNGDLVVAGSGSSTVFALKRDGSQLRRLAGRDGPLPVSAISTTCERLHAWRDGRLLCLATARLYELDLARGEQKLLLDLAHGKARHRAAYEEAQRSGVELSATVPPEIYAINVVTSDSEGRLYFADDVSAVILRWEPQHEPFAWTVVAGVHGTAGRTDGEALKANLGRVDDMAFDRDNVLYILEGEYSGRGEALRRVDGGLVSTIDLKNADGRPGLRNMRTLMAHPEGGVIVADSNGLHRVRGNAIVPMMPPRMVGCVSTENAGCGDGCDLLPERLAVDAMGSLWSITTHTVFRLSRDGGAVAVAGQPGLLGLRGQELPGSLPFLRDLAFAPNGDLILSDNSGSVLRVRAEPLRTQAQMSSNTPRTSELVSLPSACVRQKR